jgi:hypothetical protein
MQPKKALLLAVSVRLRAKRVFALGTAWADQLILCIGSNLSRRLILYCRPAIVTRDRADDNQERDQAPESGCPDQPFLKDNSVGLRQRVFVWPVH